MCILTTFQVLIPWLLVLCTQLKLFFYSLNCHHECMGSVVRHVMIYSENRKHFDTKFVGLNTVVMPKVTFLISYGAVLFKHTEI